MRKSALMVTASALLLTGCSGSGPSDSDVAHCIAVANGFEGVGEKLERKVMGRTFETVVINDVIVENVIERDKNLYVAHTLVEMGSRREDLTDQERERTAEMMGFKLEDGYLMQDVQVAYQMSEGSKGWSCREI